MNMCEQAWLDTSCRLQLFLDARPNACRYQKDKMENMVVTAAASPWHECFWGWFQGHVSEPIVLAKLWLKLFFSQAFAIKTFSPFFTDISMRFWLHDHNYCNQNEKYVVHNITKKRLGSGLCGGTCCCRSWPCLPGKLGRWQHGINIGSPAIIKRCLSWQENWSQSSWNENFQWLVVEWWWDIDFRIFQFHALFVTEKVTPNPDRAECCWIEDCLWVSRLQQRGHRKKDTQRKRDWHLEILCDSVIL